MSFSSYSFLFLLLILIIISVNLNVVESSKSSKSSNYTKIGKGYRLVSVEETPDGGFLAYLQVKKKNEIYGPDIPLLRLFVK